MADLLTKLPAIATGVGEFFVNLFTGLGGIFVNSEGEITIVAYLLLFGAVVALGQWVIRMLLRLFRLR